MKILYFRKKNKIYFRECENKKKKTKKKPFGGLCRAQLMKCLQGAVETVNQSGLIFPYPLLLSASLKKCNIAVSTCQSEDTFINHNIKSLQ
jgi:hypothetical protein